MTSPAAGGDEAVDMTVESPRQLPFVHLAEDLKQVVAAVVAGTEVFVWGQFHAEDRLPHLLPFCRGVARGQPPVAVRLELSNGRVCVIGKVAEDHLTVPVEPAGVVLLARPPQTLARRASSRRDRAGRFSDGTVPAPHKCQESTSARAVLKN